jgi:molybdate transport system ATP-binding protein
MIRIAVKKNLSLTEGHTQLDVALELELGSFNTLYGKSGAGKTTLLKLLAGLTQPEEGIIDVAGKTWLDTHIKINMPPQKREIGFVFQDFALFPNMTVRENLRYASPGKPDEDFITQLLEMVSLLPLADRKPVTLSGGQQQRVALIRALVRKPRILLLDEPLSALDWEMRHRLQDDILKLHQAFGTTTLLVSHHIPEIYRLSDQVFWVDGGKIIKKGPPATVFGAGQISSKIQLVGEVLRIQASEMVYILEISTGNSVIKIVVTAEEAANLRPGDQVMVFSKAFNPMVIKI